jgi:hypothetical protein
MYLLYTVCFCITNFPSHTNIYLFIFFFKRLLLLKDPSVRKYNR